MDDPKQSEKERERKPRQRGFLRRHPIVLGLCVALAIPAAIAGALYWDYLRHFQSTDDAFIAVRAFAVAPQVSGYLTTVPVTDNQHVEAGDVIAQIDERDYRIALDQANAQLARDEALLAQVQTNLGRDRYLARENAIPKEQADNQTFLAKQTQGSVALDKAKIDEAELNLSHTRVVAAQAGHVVSLTAAVGQLAQTGTALAMFVPDELWVTANFKETQLNAVRPRQPASVKIDAYPGRVIHGHVDSVQPGSGVAFSLLPPQNATGNWVKIVQRVPVKIVMEDAPRDVAVGSGMSVGARVRVDPHPSLYERLRARL